MLWLAQELMARVWTPIVLYFPWVAPYISYNPVLETLALVLLVVVLVVSIARLTAASKDGSLNNFLEERTPVIVSKFLTQVKGLVSKIVSEVRS